MDKWILTKMLDIQAIIDIMQSNILIPVSVSLLIGIIGSWLLLRPKVSKRDKYITELEKSTKKNAKQLKNQNESIKQYETTVETLNNELSDRENTIESAREKINELSARAKEIIFAKDRHIETLNTSLADKDKNFTKLTKRAQVMESNEK